MSNITELLQRDQRLTSDALIRLYLTLCDEGRSPRSRINECEKIIRAVSEKKTELSDAIQR